MIITRQEMTTIINALQHYINCDPELPFSDLTKRSLLKEKLLKKHVTCEQTNIYKISSTKF